MKKQILEELKEMRYLFNYDRGKIISEQNQNLNEMIDLEKGSFGYDLEEDIDDVDMDTRTPEERERNMGDRHMDTGEDLAPSFGSDGNFLGMVKPNRDGMEVDGDLIENRELEVPVKPITKPPTKPDEDSPYKPKPGTKKKPKARKGDMPDWLSFDEIGINIE